MSEDISMEALAEAYMNDPTYELEDGRTITIRKATVADYPLVLKVVRAVIKYVESLAGDTVTDKTPGQAQKVAEEAMAGSSVIDMIEDNLPMVLQVIESLTDLEQKEVQQLTLGDLLGVAQKVWAINQRFFIQAIALMQNFGPSTQQPVLQSIANPAPKRRTRKR